MKKIRSWIWPAIMILTASAGIVMLVRNNEHQNQIRKQSEYARGVCDGRAQVERASQERCAHSLRDVREACVREIDICQVNSKALVHSEEALEEDLERCMGIRPRHRR